MKISFELCSPPFSINKAYYKRSKTRTAECREWGDNILIQLQNPTIQALFDALRAGMSKHPLLGIMMEFQSPVDVLYTKSGDISRRSMDLSNIEKLLIDLIFDPRFDGRTVKDQKVRNLAIDDKFIVDMRSSKRESPDEDFHILVDIYLVDKMR